MKTKLALSLVLSGFLMQSAPANMGDFIAQIHIFNDAPDADPVIIYHPVATSEGQIESNPILGDGSIFQLYGMAPDPYNNMTPLLLDEKTVGAFYPVGEIEIISEDKHYPPRTRADRPYALRMKVTGLVDDPEAPEYAKKAHFEQEFKMFDPETNVPFEDGSAQHVYPAAFEFTKNGEWVNQVVYQDLPGENAVKVRGEEVYSFVVWEDEDTPRKQIVSAKIQIWPVAEARIVGLDSERRYTSAPRSIRIELDDLYPRSVTYVQVYPGSEQLGTLGHVLPSTVISYNTFAPQSAMVTLDDIEAGLTEDGVYTVEVLTVTPFNNGEPERLAYQSFNIDRTIKVNGAVTTHD